MKWNRWTLVALLGVVAVVAGACSLEESGQPAGALLGPEEAFDIALDELRDAYPGDAPGTEVSWKSEDVVVTGPGGQLLVGASRMRMLAADWEALVSWAVVSPEYLVYQITLKSPALGWYWEGYVTAKDRRFEEAVPLQKMDEDLAFEVAMGYVKASPTYMFDGIEVTLQQVGSRDDEGAHSWSFLFQFQSAHAGYGDRTGQALAQVITPHLAIVSVEAMEVKSAVLDEQWDMMAQAPMVTESSSHFIAEGFILTCPTYVFDGIPETLQLVETLKPATENTWVFVYRFDSRQAGYGDRTGQMLAQVITPHEAHVTVESNVVVSAVMDAKWDMLAQALLQ